MPLLPFGAPPSKGGSQTPWTSDIAGAGHQLTNTKGVLIGASAWPTAPANPNSGGAGYFIAPQTLTTNSTITATDAGPNFYAPVILNDTITGAGAGSYEIAAMGMRTSITFSDGGTGQTGTGLDIGVQWTGSNTLGQAFLIGAGGFVDMATTNYKGISSTLTLDTGGSITGKAALFTGLFVPNGHSVATVVGLDLTGLNPAQATTAWGFQIPVGANSYHGGSLVIGATAFPTATASGSSNLVPTVALVTNGTYTLTPPATDILYAAVLVNDTITVSNTNSVANTQYFGMGIYPSFTASDGKTDESFGGVQCSPTFNGTNTLANAYGLNLNATIKQNVTSAVGVGSALFVSSGTTTTATGFKFTPLAFGGTITTLVGLDLTATTSAGTAWGMKVASAYQNYIAGKTTFGGTGTPTNTIDIQGGLLNYLDSGGITYAATTAIGLPASNVISVTTTNAVGNSTFTITAAKAGTPLYLIIINDATANRTITFGAGFKVTTATLVGTASKQWIVHFISDGTTFDEVSRSGPQ